MIIMIDNYDSFTYNLVQYLKQIGTSVKVVRNDAASISDLISWEPAGIVISPGPGRPETAGISLSVVQHFSGRVPILGVCLGHQSIGAAFGGKVVAAKRLMHGKTSMIHADGKMIYQGIHKPFEAMRYHSLLVHEPLPDCLKATAFTTEGEVMAVQHKTAPLIGVQFHPESILTEHGKTILNNFLMMGKV